MHKIYSLYTDGSNLLYLDLAGYGGYIEDEQKKEIVSFSEIIIDSKLKVQHEICGLKKGLELAIEYGIKNIVCYTDDKNMAQIFNTKDYEIIKHCLNPPRPKGRGFLLH